MAPCCKVNCRLFLPQGWAKPSHSLDASEENDGWSSAEEPLNSSDAEEEGGGGGGEIKLVTRNYFLWTVWRDIGMLLKLAGGKEP